MFFEKRKCKNCGCIGIDKGRAYDGRRAYRCQNCKTIWTEGLQGREKRFSLQRIGYRFADSQSRPKDLDRAFEKLGGVANGSF